MTMADFRKLEEERQAAQAAKVPRYLKTAMDTLIKRVRFENASLTLPGHSMDKAKEDTEAIRESTLLYTETWVVPLLRAVRDGDTEFLKHYGF